MKSQLFPTHCQLPQLNTWILRSHRLRSTNYSEVRRASGVQAKEEGPHLALRPPVSRDSERLCSSHTSS